MTVLKEFSHRDSESQRRYWRFSLRSLWLIIPLWDCGKMRKVNK